MLAFAPHAHFLRGYGFIMESGAPFRLLMTVPLNSHKCDDNYFCELFQVMLIGDSCCGKTCLLIRFKDGAFLNNNFISTVGIDYRVSSINNNSYFNLNSKEVKKKKERERILVTFEVHGVYDCQ